MKQSLFKLLILLITMVSFFNFIMNKKQTSTLEEINTYKFTYKIISKNGNISITPCNVKINIKNNSCSVDNEMFNSSILEFINEEKPGKQDPNASICKANPGPEKCPCEDQNFSKFNNNQISNKNLDKNNNSSNINYNNYKFTSTFSYQDKEFLNKFNNNTNKDYNDYNIKSIKNSFKKRRLNSNVDTLSFNNNNNNSIQTTYNTCEDRIDYITTDNLLDSRYIVDCDLSVNGAIGTNIVIVFSVMSRESQYNQVLKVQLTSSDNKSLENLKNLAFQLSQSCKKSQDIINKAKISLHNKYCEKKIIVKSIKKCEDIKDENLKKDCFVYRLEINNEKNNVKELTKKANLLNKQFNLCVKENYKLHDKTNQSKPCIDCEKNKITENKDNNYNTLGNNKNNIEINNNNNQSYQYPVSNKPIPQNRLSSNDNLSCKINSLNNQAKESLDKEKLYNKNISLLNNEANIHKESINNNKKELEYNTSQLNDLKNNDLITQKKISELENKIINLNNLINESKNNIQLLTNNANITQIELADLNNNSDNNKSKLRDIQRDIDSLNSKPNSNIQNYNIENNENNQQYTEKSNSMNNNKNAENILEFCNKTSKLLSLSYRDKLEDSCKSVVKGNKDGVYFIENLLKSIN